VIEILTLYMRKLSVKNFIVQMRIGGLPHEKVLRSMKLFASEVMPALRQEAAGLAAAE